MKLNTHFKHTILETTDLGDQLILFLFYLNNCAPAGTLNEIMAAFKEHCELIGHDKPITLNKKIVRRLLYSGILTFSTYEDLEPDLTD